MGNPNSRQNISASDISRFSACSVSRVAGYKPTISNKYFSDVAWPFLASPIAAFTMSGAANPTIRVMDCRIAPTSTFLVPRVVPFELLDFALRFAFAFAMCPITSNKKGALRARLFVFFSI